MCRLYSMEVCTVMLIFMAFIAIPVPVECVKHHVNFEPTKMFTPCKNTDLPSVHKYFDLSNLKMEVATDNSMSITGYAELMVDPQDAPLSMYTTIKKKTRGRWMDVPYSNNIKDFCTVYFKEGTYWNDHITKYFVGDEKHCPPIKNVHLPINITLSLDMDFPSPMPSGEYLTHSVLKHGDWQACFEMSVELNQI